MSNLQTPAPVDLSKYIETRLMGQRPHIRGRRVPVADVAYAYGRSGLSIAQIADEYTLAEEEVFAALLFYREHQFEIDDYEKAYAQTSPEAWIEYGDDSFLLRRDDAQDGSEGAADTGD